MITTISSLITLHGNRQVTVELTFLLFFSNMSIFLLHMRKTYFGSRFTTGILARQRVM